MKINIGKGLAFAALVAGDVTFWTHRTKKVEAATIMSPRFEVDPLWPKALPNHWVTGSTIGVSVDSQDRVWTIHRPNTVEDNFKAADLKLGECCKVAPPAPVRTTVGLRQCRKFLGRSVGQGYDRARQQSRRASWWTTRVTYGSAAMALRIRKFSNSRVMANSCCNWESTGFITEATTPRISGQPTRIFEDVSANEVYITDGYVNLRVIVFDADTGKYKRHCGSY